MESWFGDNLVTRVAAGEKPSSDAYLVLRGFPGEAPPADKEKYEHLAQRATFSATIHNATGEDVYVLQYPGLGGSRGTFGFKISVERAIAFAAMLAARGYRRLHVLGYSWGGFVAFNALRSVGHKAGRLVLISPLTDLGSDEDIRRFIRPYVKDYPNLFGNDGSGYEPAVTDLIATRDAFNPITSAAKDHPAAERLLIHGTRDSEVKVGMSRRFVKVYPCRYLELEDDHIFIQHWDRMLAEVVSFIAR